MIGAGDVAGAAGAGTHPGRGPHHRADYFRVLAHSEVIVGTPHHDIALALRGMPHGMGISPRQPFEVGKHAVTPLGVQLSEGVSKKRCVIHCFDSLPTRPEGVSDLSLLT